MINTHVHINATFDHSSKRLVVYLKLNYILAVDNKNDYNSVLR